MLGAEIYKPRFLALVAVLLAVATAPAAGAGRASSAQLTDDVGAVEEVAPAQTFGPNLDLQDCDCQQSGGCPGPWFAGAEYRFIRASFSEAMAFVRVNDSITPQGFRRNVQAEELTFNFNSSMRFYLGAHVGDFQDIRVAYWHFDTDVAVNGVGSAGQTLVDPFGNIALAGASMNSRASVNMNVFDLEYLQALNFPAQGVDFMYSAGLRFANVDQTYDSVVRAGGATTSVGVFAASFSGVGPYLSLTGSTSRYQQPFSLFAKGGAAVLIGSYEVSSGVTIPGFVVGDQSAHRLRAIPIMEAELGASWQPGQRLVVSAGWMFQAWFDLGTSGGGFSGANLPVAPVPTVFGQTDDSNIMAFDGLFVRAEFRF